jgi:hypothetical protein
MQHKPALFFVDKVWRAVRRPDCLKSVLFVQPAQPIPA